MVGVGSPNPRAKELGQLKYQEIKESPFSLEESLESSYLNE